MRMEKLEVSLKEKHTNNRLASRLGHVGLLKQLA